MVSSPLTRSPAAKLAAYGVILATVLGGGAAVGAAFGPAPAHSTADPAPAVDAAAGLALSQDSYQLQLATTTVEPDREAVVRFAIVGPDRAPVTDFDVAHDRELHLIVVSRDLSTYAHLHPDRDADGTWTAAAPPLPAGSYRVYADFMPAGHRGVTLAADLAVPGDYTPQPVPAPRGQAGVDGYDVTIDGTLIAGTESELAVTVSRDGAPVTDLDPYLGALGHLVAIRAGDLAYLHVHPLDDPAATDGPTVRFAVAVPSVGTYGLYFDFSHQSTVRTAAITADAADIATPAPGPAADDGHEQHEG